MQLEKIAYTTTIVETNETQHIIADDVTVMMDNLLFNIGLAELVFGRELGIKSSVDPITDELSMTVQWMDNDEPYLLVTANKVPNNLN